MRARSLLAMDINGYSDPYCVIKVGGISHKTSVVKKSLKPLWNEVFIIYPTEIEKANGTVKFEIWDADQWTADDFLGQVLFLYCRILKALWLLLRLWRDSGSVKALFCFTGIDSFRLQVKFNFFEFPNANCEAKKKVTLPLAESQNFFKELCLSPMEDGSNSRGSLTLCFWWYHASDAAEQGIRLCCCPDLILCGD